MRKIRRLPDARPALHAARAAPRRLARAYGARPLHLLALIASFGLAGYAVTLAAGPSLTRMLVWFGAAVIGHDLVLFPLYALADRSLTGLLRHRSAEPPRVPAINHIRVPLLGAGLLLLVFFPGIARHGEATYRYATGRGEDAYLGRWLLLTGAMFAVSAVAYAVRLRRAASPR